MFFQRENFDRKYDDELRKRNPRLCRRVKKIVVYAFGSVLHTQPPKRFSKNNGQGSFNISFRPRADAARREVYLNVWSGERHFCIYAENRIVKVNKSFLPLEGTAKHNKTLDKLRAWVWDEGCGAKKAATAAKATEKKRKRAEEELEELRKEAKELEEEQVSQRAKLQQAVAAEAKLKAELAEAVAVKARLEREAEEIKARLVAVVAKSRRLKM